MRVRNTGARARPRDRPDLPGPAKLTPASERPARWLAGFARVKAGPGESVEVTVPVERRAYQVWDEEAYGWRTVPGRYEVQAARSLADIRATTTVEVAAGQSK